jgi:hypothetical protein
MLDYLKNIKVLLVAGVFALLSLIIGFMSTASPLKLSVVLFGIAVVGLCLFSRWWGALILIALAPFYGFARFVLEVPTSVILIKEAIVIIIAVSWLLDDIFLKRIKIPRNPILMPLGIFLFILAVQFLRTGNPVQGLFGLRIYITYVPLFYVLLTEKISDRQMKVSLFIMIFTVMLTVAYGFWQWTVGIDNLRMLGLAKAGPNIQAGEYLRVFSTYAGPEYFAANLIMQTLVLFSLIASTRNLAGKVIYSVCIGLMLFMLGATLYRSMWAMALVSITAILVLVRKYRYIFIIALALYALIQYSPSYVKERASLTFSREDESYQIRKELYFKTNVINVLENIIGYGVGASLGGEAYQMQTGGRRASSLLMGGSTESWLASVAIELGLAGLLVYIWLMISIIKVSVHVYRKADDAFWRGLGLGFSAFAIGDLVVSSFFLVPACFPAGDLYFWFLTAMMAKKYHQLVYQSPSVPGYELSGQQYPEAAI